MSNPIALAYDPNSNRLFMDEYSNFRLTVFNVAPSVIATGMSYSMAFLPGYGGGQTGVTYPVGVMYDPGSGRLFVDDMEGNRVMVFDGSFLSSWTPG